MKKFTLLAILLVVGFSGIAQNTSQTSPASPVLADTSAPTTPTNRTAEDVSSTVGVRVLGMVRQVQATSPVVYFSDLTDGPVTGWNGSSTKGAAVSIWGVNFGSSRGASYLTVGGVQLENDSDYAEWGATTNPTTARGLQRITFWLNSNMSLGNTMITVTTADGTSNSIPFYTRNTGNIYFVSSDGIGDGSLSNPFSPSDYIAKLQSGEDGDIAYFRSGTYDGEYAHTGWHANFCLTSSHSGANNLENAFIAYPGETVQITTSETTGADRNNFRLYSDPAKYIVTPLKKG